MRALVPGIVTDAHTMTLAKEIADALVKAYPGWLWAVSASHDQTMMYVIEQRLSGRRQFGYALKVNDLDYDLGHNLKMRAVRAGGELLERAGMRRGAFDAEAYAALPKTFTGDVMLDISDKNGKTFTEIDKIWDICKKASYSARVKP